MALNWGTRRYVGGSNLPDAYTSLRDSMAARQMSAPLNPALVGSTPGQTTQQPMMQIPAAPPPAYQTVPQPPAPQVGAGPQQAAPGVTPITQDPYTRQPLAQGAPGTAGYIPSTARGASTVGESNWWDAVLKAARPQG